MMHNEKVNKEDFNQVLYADGLTHISDILDPIETYWRSNIDTTSYNRYGDEISLSNTESKKTIYNLIDSASKFTRSANKEISRNKSNYLLQELVYKNNI